MFRGRFAHTMDKKGRVSIPAAFRSEFEERSDRPPFLTLGQMCLELYHHEDWLAHEQQLVDGDPFSPAAKRMRRRVIASAVEVTFDGQGRILVPDFLRKDARLERDVTILGAGLDVEIWDRALLEQDLDDSTAQYDEYSDRVARKDDS